MQNTIMWSVHDKDYNMQLDCTPLEEMYLGRQKLNEKETAEKWNELLTQRRTVLCDSADSIDMNLGDGGKLQEELNQAIAAVHRASFMSRSLQKNFLSINKNDNSPVTIADFAVQALIIDALHRAFPEDKFIAEEDSSVLKSDPALRSAVLTALTAASSSHWSEERLYDIIDLGGFTGTSSRVWVLDPVDGTKGFMRGEHYCIALALLVNGGSQLSVMGCPNVNLKRVLQPGLTASKGEKVADIDHSFQIASAGAGHSSDLRHDAHPVSTGSVFYAVSGRGAWARSLAMPLGSGFEVSVSEVSVTPHAALCESMEASHGDRAMTIGVFNRLGLTKEYLRLDGQCKYCVVGSGAAEGNMRLPPAGYREKVWDHVPGVHFIQEAGGTVTDIDGRELDFSQGRLLPENVTGILATNRALHKEILAAIQNERMALKKGVKSPGRVYLD